MAFDAAHDVAYSTLWSVGILPGLSVFRGQIAVKEYAIRFRCVVASGTNANGERELIYPSDPSDPCPTTGLRWKPETYRHMFFHWVWFIDDALTPWNLWAMADHFCHLSPVTGSRIRVRQNCHRDRLAELRNGRGHDSSAIDRRGKMPLNVLTEIVQSGFSSFRR